LDVPGFVSKALYLRLCPRHKVKSCTVVRGRVAGMGHYLTSIMK